MATESNDETYALLQNIPQDMMDAIGTHGATVAIDASSKEEMEYKRKVLNKIIEETEANELPIDETQMGVLYHHVLTGGGILKLAFRPTGSFMITGTGDEAMDSMGILGREAWDKIVSPLYSAGAVFNAAPYACWAVQYGEGSGHVESLVQYDPASSESVNTAVEQFGKADHIVAEMGFSINSLENALSYNESALKAAMPYVPVDFVKHMKMIKRAIDPNNSSDPAFYVSPDEWE